MTGTTRSSAGLDPRRKRLLFRSWHRGTREMDLLLGRFADHAILDMDTAALDAYEALIEAPDDDLFAWITERSPVPVDYSSGVVGTIVAFHKAHPGAGRTE